MRHQLIVIETATDEVVETFDPCSSLRMAEKLENGVNINMDHDEFHTIIDEVE